MSNDTSEDATYTMQQFINKWGLQFESRSVPSRPDGLMSDRGQNHFRCKITRKRGANGDSSFPTRSFSLYFSMGSALQNPPTLEEVLDCVAMDASGYEDAQAQSKRPLCVESVFECWAGEYGYDADSRSAEKIYKTVKRQANQLKRVLGQEAYQELLWNTERL